MAKITNSAAIFDDSYVAGADLSALEGTAVKLSAEGTVVGAGAGESAHGALMNAPKSGEEARVRILGIAQMSVSAGTAILIDDPLKVSASGVLVKATTNLDKIAGHALAPLASGTGTIPVLLTPKKVLAA